jgi:pimeloyl-ACP methyl ester carboxylesterase
MNPILILHGALGSAAQLYPLQALLERSGKKIFLANFSGHGGSPFEDEFSIEQFADELLQFLEDQNLKHVNVFGYSMGGYVALWAAHLRPDFFNNIVTLGTKFDWTVSSAQLEIKKLNPEKIKEKVPAFAETLAQRHAPNDWKEVVTKTANLMMRLGNKPLLTQQVLEHIQHPVTICLGDKDDLTSAAYSEQVAANLPRGRFILLEKTPHPIEKVEGTVLQQILLHAFS